MPLSRQEMLNELQRLNFPTSAITDAVSDGTLQSFIKDLGAAAEKGDETEHEFAEDEDRDDDGDDGDDGEDGDGDDGEDGEDGDHDDHDEFADEDDDGHHPQETDEEDEPETADHADMMPYSDIAGKAAAAADDDADYEEMSREEMLAALQSIGARTADQLNALSDQELETLYNQDVAGGNLDRPGNSELDKSPENDKPTATKHADITPFAEESMPRDEMCNALVAHGHDQEELDKLSDEELQALYDHDIGSEAVQKNAEGSPPMDEQVQSGAGPGNEAQNHGGVAEHSGLPDDPQTHEQGHDQNQPLVGGTLAPQQVKKMSENAIRQLVRKVVAEELTPAVSTAKEQVGQLLQVPKRQNIEKYCEDLVRNGKLLRAEKARTIARLMRADTNPVFKFSEKKKTGETVQVKKSELDLQMEARMIRPADEILATQPSLSP